MLVGWCVVWAPCNNDVPGDGISKLNHYICLIVFHSLTFVVMCASSAVCFFSSYFILLHSAAVACKHTFLCACVCTSFLVRPGATDRFWDCFWWHIFVSWRWLLMLLRLILLQLTRYLAVFRFERDTHTHTANNDEKKDQRFTYMKIQLAYISFIVLRKGREKESTTVLSCMHMRTFYLLGILVQPTRDETVSGIGKKRLTSVRMVWDTANGM